MKQVRSASCPHGIICSAENQVDWIEENNNDKPYRCKSVRYRRSEASGDAAVLMYRKSPATKEMRWLKLSRKGKKYDTYDPNLSDFQVCRRYKEVMVPL